MIEHVQTKLDNIQRKIAVLGRQFQDERAKNAEIQEKLKMTENQLRSSFQAIDQHKLEIAALKLEIENSQVVSSSPSSIINEEKINELVKEIDYCISQLKR